MFSASAGFTVLRYAEWKKKHKQTKAVEQVPGDMLYTPVPRPKYDQMYMTQYFARNWQF